MRTFLTTLAALAALLTGLALPQAAQAGRKVIIDQDTFGPGGSNLQSVLMLLHASDVEVIGITVVSGDGWRDEEVDHLLRLLELVGRPDVPVYAGAIMPLVNTPARLAAWEHRYGPLDYRGAWSPVRPEENGRRHVDPTVVPSSPAGATRLKAASGSAVAFLIDSVHRWPGQVTIWAGGPMTDLALASRLDPSFASSARELVFMGGSFNPVPADNAFAAEYANSPRREFNFRWDPEAASMVLHEPWKRIVQIPIDATTPTLFRPELFAEIGRSSTAGARYVARWGQSFPMWDEVAAAAWIDPSLVTRRESLLVDVDTADGGSYGDTLSWRVGHGPGLGEPVVEVIRAVDVPKLERLVIKLLSE